MLCKVTKWLTWYLFPQRGWSYFTQICSSQELEVFTKPSVFILRHKVITFISAQHLQYRPIVRLTMSLLNVRALDGIQGTRAHWVLVMCWFTGEWMDALFPVCLSVWKCGSSPLAYGNWRSCKKYVASFFAVGVLCDGSNTWTLSGIDLVKNCCLGTQCTWEYVLYPSNFSVPILCQKIYSLTFGNRTLKMFKQIFGQSRSCTSNLCKFWDDVMTRNLHSKTCDASYKSVQMHRKSHCLMSAKILCHLFITSMSSKGYDNT